MTDADYRALAEFRHQIRKFLHFSEELTRAEGLEAQQHQILLSIRAVGQGEGMTIGALAEHMLIRHHSAVGLVDRLELHGLVERARGVDDRRQVLVRLTAAGAAKVKRLAAAHQEELRNSGPRLIAALRDAMQGAEVRA